MGRENGKWEKVDFFSLFFKGLFIAFENRNDELNLMINDMGLCLLHIANDIFCLLKQSSIQ